VKSVSKMPRSTIDPVGSKRALRIGRLQRERVVDDERRRCVAMRRRSERGGRAGKRHKGDERQRQLPPVEERATQIKLLCLLGGFQ